MKTRTGTPAVSTGIPVAGPVVDVVATAKRHLKSGDILDGLGGYTYHDQRENADLASLKSLLPAGPAEGCRLKRPVDRDAVLTYDDVELPAGRRSDTLRWKQNKYFAFNSLSKPLPEDREPNRLSFAINC